MSLKDSITKSVTEYLESISIHGFGYLSTGRNILEKLLWLIIICTCFTLAALLIRQSIEEASLNPVMTNVETVQVREVPFPAITIDSGDPDQTCSRILIRITDHDPFFRGDPKRILIQILFSELIRPKRI